MARKKVNLDDYDVIAEMAIATKVAQKHFNEMKKELIKDSDDDLIRVVLRMAMIPVLIEKMTLLKISEVDKGLAKDCENMQSQLRNEMNVVRRK